METPLVIKEAAEKTKKEPGILGRMGVKARAMNEPGSLRFVNKELEEKRRGKMRPVSKKYVGRGAVAGAITFGGLRAAIIKGLGSRGRIDSAIRILGSVAAGGLVGAGAGKIVSIPKLFTVRREADEEFLKSKGIETSRTGRIIGMTDEAKKKYLHKKYSGGGYEKGVPTIKQ